MGLSIYMFAGPKDFRALFEQGLSLGLHFYPILMEQQDMLATDDPAAAPYALLSWLPRDALHPYGDRPRIGPATDPLLQFMLPYFRPPDLLVIGRLYCSNDVPRLFSETKPYFMKLRKWIRDRWEKLPTGQYIGPEAKSLVEKGARLAYFPPGTPVETRIVTGPREDGGGIER